LAQPIIVTSIGGTLCAFLYDWFIGDVLRTE
jgi:hypothetical protein